MLTGMTERDWLSHLKKCSNLDMMTENSWRQSTISRSTVSSSCASCFRALWTMRRRDCAWDTIAGWRRCWRSWRWHTCNAARRDVTLVVIAPHREHWQHAAGFSLQSAKTASMV